MPNIEPALLDLFRAILFGRAFGIDVSLWQAYLDWQFLKRSGVLFAFIKASQGYKAIDAAYIDPRFKENWENSLIGILRGAYHYFSPFIDPIVQADFFSTTIGGTKYNGELPPVADIEWKGPAGPKLADKIYKFLTRVYDRTGRMPIIYTSKGYWDDFVYYIGRNGKKIQVPWAVAFDLWDANYRLGSPVLPIVYKDIGWLYWQFSCKGRFAGLRKDFDFNVFNGPYDKLLKHAIIGAGTGNAPPVRERVQIVYRSVWVRSGPGIQHKTVSGITAGNIREVYDEDKDAEKNTWVKISSANEWICLTYHGTVLATYL